ncbi:transcriptional regulator [Immundisolibacter sp.]
MGKAFLIGSPVMISSKPTSKARATIPQSVGVAPHLESGDELVYEIADQRVILTKARTVAGADDPFRTFEE